MRTKRAGTPARRSRWARLPALGLALVTGAGVITGAGLLSVASSPVPAQAATVTAASGQLTQTMPTRILDTRTTTGGHHGKLGPNSSMTLKVLGNGVPVAGVSAVMVNVTAANETAKAGYLTLYPTGGSRPVVSSLNYRAGIPVANQALVRVGTDGTITIFNNAGSADVVIDVVGWAGTDPAASAGEVTTAAPVRVLDTRTANGGHHGKLANNQTLTLQVTGRLGVPAGVTAVWANITAVPASGQTAGYLTAYPATSARPASSSVNFVPGVVTSNFMLLPVSSSGAVKITNESPGAQVVVDIQGWLSGGTITADAGTAPASPIPRVLDTRTTTGGHKGVVGAAGTVSVGVLGVGGVPASGVAAVLVHVTAVAPTASTYLKAWAAGYPTPGTSVVNSPKGGDVSATALVAVGPQGKVSIYNDAGNVNVVVDVQGWVAAPQLTVTPPQAAALSAGASLTTSEGQAAQAILINATKYAVTTWRTGEQPTLSAAPIRSQIVTNDLQGVTSAAGPGVVSAAEAATATGVPDTSTTDNTRRLSMEAYMLATSLATGVYDQGLSQGAYTYSKADAISFTVGIINKVITNHMVNKTTSGGWGATTESQLDSTYIGTAAWLLWPDLTATQQQEVAKMVYFEAAWAMGEPLQFYASVTGTILQPGDTGSDPDSWDAMPIQLAVAMFPASPMVAVWQNSIVRDALVAWARPSDDTSSTVVNGQPVSAWLASRGSNVLANGMVVNHDRYAPDYMTLVYQNMQDILVTSLAGTAAPQAITTLVGPVYAAYTKVAFPKSGAAWSWAPSYDSDGGTIYPALSANSAAVYYPQDSDWGTGQEIPYALADAQTQLFGIDTGANGTVPAATAASYQALHAAAELSEQDSHADGSTYGSNTTAYTYAGREEHTAQLAAQLYLTEYISEHSLMQPASTASYWLAP